MPKFSVGDSVYYLQGGGLITSVDGTRVRWEPGFRIEPVIVMKILEKGRYSLLQYSVRNSNHGFLVAYEFELLTKEEAFVQRLKGMKSA
jgi:hypothetical protein